MLRTMLPNEKIDDPNRATAAPPCRFCGLPLSRTFADLGMSPLCESFVPPERANAMEPFFPLHARVCDGCRLVQLEAYVTPDEIFTEYAYFSSYSTSLGRACARLRRDDRAAAGSASTTRAWSSSSRAMTAICSSTSSARASRSSVSSRPPTSPRPLSARGVPTLVEFFGRETAEQLVSATGGRRTSSSVTTCWRRFPISTTSSPASLPARADGDGDIRVPASAATDRRAPVRHDLPRALLLFLARDDRRDHASPRARRATTSRSSRPTAARFASTSASRARRSVAAPGGALIDARARSRSRRPPKLRGVRVSGSRNQSGNCSSC